MIKRILIVDDNSANLYLLETLLKGYGLTVTSAVNGRDALDKARFNPPDLLITDILMPVMDGYALCREWKADERLRHIPLVFYTATYTESKDEAFALSLGADRFIVKPQEPKVFMNMIKDVLEEKYVPKQAAVQPLGEEMEFFRQHNEILFNKLEKKMMDLETAHQRLKIMEERYRLSFENIMDVVYTVDIDLNIMDMSPSVERTLGYKPRDFIGRHVSSLSNIFTPESFAQAISDASLVLMGESIPATIYRLIARDGTQKVFEVSGSPVKQDGRIIGLISVARDITDRMRAEEKVRESEERFRAIADYTYDWENWFGPDGKLIWVNPGVFRFSGYSVEECLAMNDFPMLLIDEVHHERLAYHFTAAIQQASGNDIEFRIRCKDGSLKWAAASYQPIYDSNGVNIGHRSSIRDITDRKRADEALRESEKKYRELYDFLPIPVYEMDLDGKITSANQAIYETFGGTEEDLKKGFRVWQILSPEEIDKSRKNIQRLIMGEQIRGTEYNTIKRLDGSLFPAIVISSVIYENNKPVGLRGAIIDITERRHQEEELRRMNVFLNSIVENIPDMIFLKDVGELRFVQINRAGEELLGYFRDGLLGKNDYDFFPKDQADSFTKKDREVFHRNELVDIPEERIQTRNKGERILHTKKIPLLNEKEEPEYLLGISEDITDRKRAEEALRESEEKYRGILENMDDAYYELDLKGNFVFFNEALILKTGYSREELMGMNYRRYISPDTSKLVTKVFSEIYKSGQPIRLFDYEIIMKGGHTRYFESWADLLFDNNKQPVGFRGMSRDITVRKEAEEALKESEERYRSVFENHTAVKFLIDPDSGSIIEVNDAAVKYYGWSHEQLRQMKIQEINTLSPDDVLAEIEKARTRKQTHFEFRHRRADGSIRDVEVFSSTVDVKGKRFLHSIVHDITERKRAENALLREHEELETAHMELKKVQAQVIQQEKMASIGQLAAGIAHEINNPMSFIKGNLDVLRAYMDGITKTIAVQEDIIRNHASREALENHQSLKKKLGADYILQDIGHLISQSLEGTDRVRKIVADLKTFSRMEEEVYESDDINAALESTINIVWNEIKYKAELVKEFGVLPLVRCNIGHLNQVFMNLLVNAAQAIEKRGKVTVRTWTEGNDIYFSVGDTGSGIGEENLTRIFDPFFTTKEKGKGTGLGLSISYDIVKRHKGDISVTSRIGEGTTFTVRIPITRQ